MIDERRLAAEACEIRLLSEHRPGRLFECRSQSGPLVLALFDRFAPVGPRFS